MGTFENTFNQAGTFDYGCAIHGRAMPGRIIVSNRRAAFRGYSMAMRARHPGLVLVCVVQIRRRRLRRIVTGTVVIKSSGSFTSCFGCICR